MNGGTRLSSGNWSWTGQYIYIYLFVYFFLFFFLSFFLYFLFIYLLFRYIISIIFLCFLSLDFSMIGHFHLYMSICVCVNRTIDVDLGVVLDGSSFWADWHHCILYSTLH